MSQKGNLSVIKFQLDQNYKNNLVITSQIKQFIINIITHNNTIFYCYYFHLFIYFKKYTSTCSITLQLNTSHKFSQNYWNVLVQTIFENNFYFSQFDGVAVSWSSFLAKKPISSLLGALTNSKSEPTVSAFTLCESRWRINTAVLVRVCWRETQEQQFMLKFHSCSEK